MSNNKCKKEDILTFLNVLVEYSISHEKSGHVIQKEDDGSPTQQYYSYATRANLNKAKQNLPEMSRDVS